MPFNRFSRETKIEDVIRERGNDVSVIAALEEGKAPGRIRTLTRSAPTSATDVVAGDAEGDVVVGATYIYTLVSISGTLKWDRRAHSAAW